MDPCLREFHLTAPVYHSGCCVCAMRASSKEAQVHLLMEQMSTFNSLVGIFGSPVKCQAPLDSCMMEREQ